MYRLGKIEFFLMMLMTISRLAFANPLNVEEKCKHLPSPIVLASNNLGFVIARKIKTHENILFSPLSLFLSFGMQYLGAAGNTAKQMEDVLGYQLYNISGDQVHTEIKKLYEDIREQANKFEHDLTIANALFYNNFTSIKNDFLRDIRSYYHSDALPVDFASQPTETTALINDWIKRKTVSKITEFYEEPLPADTQAILTNAVYFKGTWEIKFPRRRSFQGHFFNINNPSEGKTSRMMTMKNQIFPYFEDREIGYKFLELPYKGGKISMLLALPVRYYQYPDLEMNPELFCKIQDSMVKLQIEDLVIPNFNLTYEKNLEETMKSLGMVDAFTPSLANFSAMYSKSAFYISEVVHKAVIEVNEKGSEAAAVNAIKISPRTRKRRYISFIADHPFQFYIVDKSMGIIIFSGLVMDPSSTII